MDARFVMTYITQSTFVSRWGAMVAYLHCRMVQMYTHSGNWTTRKYAKSQIANVVD